MTATFQALRNQSPLVPKVGNIGKIVLNLILWVGPLAVVIKNGQFSRENLQGSLLRFYVLNPFKVIVSRKRLKICLFWKSFLNLLKSFLTPRQEACSGFQIAAAESKM